MAGWEEVQLMPVRTRNDCLEAIVQHQLLICMPRCGPHNDTTSLIFLRSNLEVSSLLRSWAVSSATWCPTMQTVLVRRWFWHRRAACDSLNRVERNATLMFMRTQVILPSRSSYQNVLTIASLSNLFYKLTLGQCRTTSSVLCPTALPHARATFRTRYESDWGGGWKPVLLTDWLLVFFLLIFSYMIV